MDHGHHGHGDMDMGDQCSMNMLFTFSTKNLCIVFRQWRITGPFSLLLSIVAVILLSVGYEAVRDFTRRYEASSAIMLKDSMPTARNARQAAEERRSKMALAALYAVQVFYSFFIMLLFMTYNGWVMISVAVGAFIGYMAFGQSSAAKSVSCH
ncbi:hypothetical protein VTO42DRAFT_3832 [Malbranchea cinnamomea]